MVIFPRSQRPRWEYLNAPRCDTHSVPEFPNFVWELEKLKMAFKLRTEFCQAIYR